MEDLIADDSLIQNKELMKPMRKVFHVYIYRHFVSVCVLGLIIL